MNEPVDYEIVERWLAGQATTSDEEQLRRMRDENPHLRAELHALREHWSVPNCDVEMAWRKLAATIETTSSRPNPRPASIRWRRKRATVTGAILAAAACLVLFLGYPDTWLRTFGSGAWNEVTAPYGQRAEVTLPDGSFAVLNSGSRLRFPDRFTGRRDVFLEGEAYFDVQNQVDQPFRVEAAHGLITVLGTQFSVRAFELDATVRVAVREGLVTIVDAQTVRGEEHALGRLWGMFGRSREYRGREQQVSPGEVALLHSNGKPAIVLESGADDSFAWLDNVMVFDDTRLEDIARELTRLYDVEFIVDSSIATRRFTGRLHRRPLHDLLSSISVTTETSFTIDRDTVYLQPQRLPAPH